MNLNLQVVMDVLLATTREKGLADIAIRTHDLGVKGHL